MSAPLPNQYCLPPEGSDEDDQYDDVVQNLYLIMMMLAFQQIPTMMLMMMSTSMRNDDMKLRMFWVSIGASFLDPGVLDVSLIMMITDEFFNEHDDK